MSYAVFLTDDAAHDLNEIYDYIAMHDGSGKADHVAGQIEKAFLSLGDSPERGAYPKELLALGIREYREIFSNPTASFTES